MAYVSKRPAKIFSSDVSIASATSRYERSIFVGLLTRDIQAGKFELVILHAFCLMYFLYA